MSTPERRRNQYQRRPTTIGELSERALDNLYDENKPLKHYLKIAERYRKDARDYNSKGDLENAFIYFARAATLVLDKLPTHREFYTLLNATQRSNLNLNGTDILEDLGDLKRKLTKRYEEWMREHPDNEEPIPLASTSSISVPQNDPDSSLRHSRSKGKERDRGRHSHQRRIQEEYSLWRQDDYDIDDVDELAERERRRNRERDAYRDRGVFVTPQPSPRAQDAKKEAAVSAAREAAFMSQTTPTPDYTFSRPPLRSQNGQTNVARTTPRPDSNEQGRRYMESERQYQYEQQQKEMRHREEEILRKREQETRRRGEEEGIMRRQRESEDAARAARSDPRVFDDTGSRAGGLAAQSSIASIASVSTMASSAPSTLFQQRSPTPSMVTTPASSFYQGPAPTSFYAPMPGSSSTQVVVTAPPSNPNPGSSLTTVMYTDSRNSTLIPPSHTAMPNPDHFIQSQVPPHRQITPPQATQQVPQQVPHRAPLSSHEPPPQITPPQPIPSPQPATAPQHGPPSVSFQDSTRPPSFVEGGPTILPIEPARLDGDTTDSESIYNVNLRRDEKQQSNVAYLQTGGRPELHRTPTRSKIRSPSPVTTTSPPPPEAGRAILSYPRLMSQHQKKQGYYPSSNSMFAPAQVPHPRSRDHVAGGFYSNAPEILHNQQRYQGFYPFLPSQQPSPASSSSSSSQRRVSYPGLPQHVIPVALPTPPVYSSVSSEQSVHGLLPTPPSSARSTQSSSSRQVGGLKTVTLPKEVLPRFLAIAKVNTAMNRETCGLLLGKDKGSKFVVTTLLIPKQHSTSDTCTMDEEELVLQFTEERSLITLGWIHTHPSQSCFMSSLDLHTHSGFQRMLPESFAVVCAPKSTPNYGIFRLTDPPGLKIILECREREAFHPHPDSPIYTDADKGHVQIKDGAPLEIVDLR